MTIKTLLNKTGLFYFIFVFFFAVVSPLQAGNVTIPNNFTAGTPAVANEVNDNFTAVENEVDDNDTRITALENTIAMLQANLANVMALNAYLTVSGTNVTFSGVNLRIDNGLGATNTTNGLGNVVIGYDEANTNIMYVRCSDGAFNDQISCEGAGNIWSTSHKTGSHYLVLGTQNSYSRYGGLVVGYGNFATGVYSNVSGGQNNTASGLFSSISGGLDRYATGNYDWAAGALFSDF